MNRQQRILLTRILTAFLLILLFLRWNEHATLSGIGSPPLFTVDLDITYWLYVLSGIPAWLTTHRPAAICFDLLLFATGILSFIYPLKRQYIIPFSILLAFYAITFNLYANHHLAQVIGFMIVLLPCWCADDLSFYLAWQGMRYFTCLVYTFAFLWKTVFNNSFYYWHQGVNSFKGNLVEYMTLNPDSWMTAIYQWFLRHDWLLDTGEKCIILLEGVMIIGFFTKKYDRFLFWCPVAIHVLTYFFSDVFFIELLVLDLSLLSPAALSALSERIKKVTARR